MYYRKYNNKLKTGFASVVLYDIKFLFIVTIEFYITVPTKVI